MSRFGGQAQSVLLAAAMEIQRTLDWLQERVAYWQCEVEHRQREVERAQAALAVCERSGYRDRDGHYYQPDCSAQRHAVAQAQARLAEAKVELAKARYWLGQVQQAAAKYGLHADRLKELTTSRNEKAQAFLINVLAELERYLAAEMAAGSAVVSGLVNRMARGTVDLSRGAEWGKFAHGAYEEALEEAFPGQARSEVRVRVTLPDGTQKEGRVDSLLGGTVIDYKTHNLDQLNQDGRLQRALDEIKSQVRAYCTSPDTPPGATAVVLFEFPPADPACRQFVEEYLAADNIQISWGAE
ncbi:MAG: hypothetical protein AB1566_01580 [Chloroflexota bacterium]